MGTAREGDAEGRARAGGRDDLGRAAVGGGDGAHDRQAEAGPTAGSGARAVGAPELLEDVGRFVGAEAGAVVAHLDDRVGAAHRDTDPHRRAFRSVRAGVGEQVGEHLADAAFVADDRRDAVDGDLDGVVRVRGTRVGRGVGRESIQVDRLVLERAALVESRQEEEVVDEHAHARRLGFDALHRLREVLGPLVGAAPEQFGVAADRREWRAELVRRVRGELSEPRLGGLTLRERPLDLSEHAVQGQAEATDLGLLGRRFDPLRQVAGRDLVGRVAHALEWPQPESDEPPSERAERGQHDRHHHQFDEHEAVQRPLHVVERERDDECVAVRDAFRGDPVLRPVAGRVDRERPEREVRREVGRCGRRAVTCRPGAPTHRPGCGSRSSRRPGAPGYARRSPGGGVPS